MLFRILLMMQSCALQLPAELLALSQLRPQRQQLVCGSALQLLVLGQLSSHCRQLPLGGLLLLQGGACQLLAEILVLQQISSSHSHFTSGSLFMLHCSSGSLLMLQCSSLDSLADFLLLLELTRELMQSLIGESSNPCNISFCLLVQTLLCLQLTLHGSQLVSTDMLALHSHYAKLLLRIAGLLPCSQLVEHRGQVVTKFCGMPLVEFQASSGQRASFLLLLEKVLHRCHTLQQMISFVSKNTHFLIQLLHLFIVWSQVQIQFAKADARSIKAALTPWRFQLERSFKFLMKILPGVAKRRHFQVPVCHHGSQSRASLVFNGQLFLECSGELRCVELPLLLELLVLGICSLQLLLQGVARLVQVIQLSILDVHQPDRSPHLEKLLLLRRHLRQNS
mmetsp:Transcript_139769/g.257307  ORF Transcript_139769/g.257307 Transcript_139769/m.257307 type:complete len:394 (-) Transcript_139769:446-1627(-)